MNKTSSITKAPIPKTDAYVPGVCNINSAEIARRRKAGYVGLALLAALTVVLLWLNLPRLTRLILFVPAFIAAIGFLQAYYKFCVGYGAAHLQNAGEGDKVAQEIVDKAARQLDTQRTRKINFQAAGLAVLATAVLLLIP